jgi:hypothetical protein
MGTNDKLTWSDLTPTQQRLIIVAGVAEVVLTTVAMRDLGRRPASTVRGPKLLWRLACVVQPVGPIAYLVVGRR